MNQDQAEAERVAREVLVKAHLSPHRWTALHSVIAAAILAAEERGKRSRDDEVSKLVGKIDDLRAECLRAYSNGD